MSGPGLQYRILGRLEAEGPSGPISLGGRRQRAVLALLLLEANRLVTLDRIVDRVWDGRPPASATGTTQAYISHLRRVLEPDRPRGAPSTVLLTQGPGYKLVVEPAQVDAHRFTQLAEQGAAALAAGDPAEADRLLEEAAALWQGDALADLRDEPFARLEAARLDERRLVALEDWIDARLALGHHAVLVGELDALVTEHPVRERLRGQHITALYRAGRQADALASYQAARESMAEELGLDPAPALQDLERAILTHDPRLDWTPPARVAGSGRTQVIVVEPGDDALEAGVVGLPSAPPYELIGRGAELGLLYGGLDRALRGIGGVVAIGGEPGIGKTRLTAELARAARTMGAVVVWGRCFEGEGAPAYWPWLQIVRGLARSVGLEALQRAFGPAASQIAAVVPEAVQLFDPAGGAPGLDAPPADPNIARFRLFDASARSFGRLASEAPLVLLLDDLQWADTPSLELLAFLGEQIGERHLLIVGTYRSTEVATNAALGECLAQLSRSPHSERLELGALDEEEVAALLTAVGGGSISVRLAADVLERTGGNPFYVTELARLLVSEPGLCSGDAETVLRKEVPASVRDVTRRRLAALPEPTRTLVEAAAVIGREFDFDLLVGPAGCPPHCVLERLEPALLEGVVVDAEDGLGIYQFAHPLIRETVYEGLAPLRRTELHLKVAEALEEAGAARDERLVELAHHLSLAAPIGDPERALGYAERASVAAVTRLAFEQAESLLTRAIGLLERLVPSPERDRRELAIRIRRAELLLMTHGYSHTDVGVAWERAAALAEAVGDPAQRLACRWGLWAFTCVRADFPAARAHAERGLAEAVEAHDALGIALGHKMLGVVSMHQGRLAEARVSLEEGLRLAEDLPLEGPAGTVFEKPAIACRAFLAFVEALDGRAERARALSAEATALADASGHPFSRVFTWNFSAYVKVALDEPDGVRATAEKVLALVSEHGFRQYMAMAIAVRGWALAMEGDPVGGEAEIRAGCDGMTSSSAGMFQPMLLGMLAEARYQDARSAEALDALDQALEHAEATGEGFWVPRLKGLRARILAGTAGSGDKALEPAG